MSRLTLDHIGIMGAELAPMARQYERLGFRLAPRSQHHGARMPGGPVTRWGTGNHCIMLRQGYIELLAVVEPGLFDNRVPEFVARYAGAHIIAFGCAEAEAEAARLRPLGLAQGVARLERPLGPEAGDATLLFDLVRLDAAALPEGRMLVIRHRTPELLWQDALLEHPNGAVSLESIAIVVDEPAARAASYAAALGAEGAAEEEGVRFALARGALLLATATGAARRGWSASPCRPHIAMMEVGVTSLEKVARVLHGHGIPFLERERHILVPPSEACGVNCRFSPVDARDFLPPAQPKEACS